MNNLEQWNIVEALRGYAKWLREHRSDPDKYHDPLPMVPDQLDRIADLLQQHTLS